MPRSGTLDPLDKFRWRIYVSDPTGAGFIRGGFSECSAPGVTINYKEYHQSGKHMNPLLIHENATFKAIILKRGVIAKTGVDDFNKWINLAYSAFTGVDKAVQYRKNIIIEHLDRSANVIKRYTLLNCVPSDYEPASDFSAIDDGSYSLEMLTFRYEGFTEETLESTVSATELIKGLF